jgi:Helix-turn-helix domain
MLTQMEKVRNYLEAGRTLTSAEARARFGIANLSARIYDLRQEGMVIGTEAYTRKNGAKAVKYVMRTRRGSRKAV